MCETTNVLILHNYVGNNLHKEVELSNSSDGTNIKLLYDRFDVNEYGYGKCIMSFILNGEHNAVVCIDYKNVFIDNLMRNFFIHKDYVLMSQRKKISEIKIYEEKWVKVTDFE